MSALKESLSLFKRAAQEREANGQPSATLGEALGRFKEAHAAKFKGDLACVRLAQAVKASLKLGEV